MEVHWEVSWTSKSGGDYRLAIFDDAWHGGIVRLNAAAHPFVTEEDEDEDFFLPIRIQRGQLNLLDTGFDLDGGEFDWTDILPTHARSRKVELVHNMRVVWRGWLEPGTYSGEFGQYPQDRSYSAVDALGVMGGEDFEPTHDKLKDYTSNFALLLSVLLQDWQYAVFQLGSADNVQGWLSARVNWWTFSDEGNASMSKKDVLEEVCKFFGWTARSDGETIYFVKPDSDDKLVKVSVSGLKAMGTTNKITGQEIDVSTCMLGDVYRDSECTETIVGGWRKVTVRSDIGKMDHVLNIPWNEQSVWERQRYVTDVEDLNGGSFISHVFTLLQDNDEKVRQFQGTKISVSGLHDFTASGAGFRISDTVTNNEITSEHKTNYQWDHVLEVACAEDLSSGVIPTRGPLATIEGLWPVTLNKGTLYISGSVFEKYVLISISLGATTSFDCSGYLYATVEIGGTLLGGDFLDQIMIGTWDGIEHRLSLEGTGSIINTRVYSSEEGEYEGFGYRIDGKVSGRVIVKIYGVNIFPMQNIGATKNRVGLSNLKFGFVQDLTEEPHSQDDTNVYERSNGAAWKEERDVDLVIATWKNNMPGTGIVMNDRNEYIEKFPKLVNGSKIEVRPEEELAQRMADYGSSGKRQVLVEVDQEVTPSMMCVLRGRRYYPMAIGKDWWDDTVRVLLMEVD